MDFDLKKDSDKNREYLNLARADDLKDNKERFIYRCFEILPGFLSWSTIVLAFLVSWLIPFVAAIFIIVFDFFWFLRIVYLSFYQFSSYFKMKNNIKTDWIKRLKELAKKGKNWKEIYHLVILPFYKEGPEIVRSSLEAIRDSNYPKERIIVVLAAEERAGQLGKETAVLMEKEFGRDFFKFLVTYHPENISGEIAGKGSNLAWAVKRSKELIDQLKITYEKVIVSDFDIDTKPFPQYFACLTFNYLIAKNPLRSSFQPVPVYHNNVWQAPSFSRVIATSGTFWQMMQQERQEQLVTYSSHAIPFKVLNEIGYPNTMVSDDSRIFWRAFLFYNGEYKVVPLFYPISMDAVMTSSLWKTIVNQYKQQRRWAWGSENIPYIIYGFLKNRKIKLREKIRHVLVILDGFWSWSTSALLIFFLGWLPLILGSKIFQVSLLSYNLPRVTSSLMTIAMVGMLVSATISMLILPAPPKGTSIWKRLSMAFQWLLLPVTLIAFGAIPALDAQTRLMLNKPLGFWPTEKTRK